MRYSTFTFALLAALTLTTAATTVATTAHAQQGYSAWSNPDAKTGGGQTLVDELNTLIDKAEKARAADPLFLRDLRDLTRRHNRPRRTSLLRDDFSDGDFTANPAWTVGDGKYWIEKGWGLRSAIDPEAAAGGGAQQGAGGGEDIAVTLLRGLLNQAGRQNNRTSTQRQPAFTAIYTPLPISNAFSIALEVSSWKSPGRLDIGPYTGQARDDGYRLVYRSGEPLLLTRVTARGSAVIDASAALITLEDKKRHHIVWQRHADGTMKVEIDGTVILKSVDRAFDNPFDGFGMIDRGGDFTVRRVEIDGTK